MKDAMPNVSRKEIFRQFNKLLCARLPLFDLLDKKTDRWQWRAYIAPRLFFFIEVITPNLMENFFVELAWSNEPEYPFRPTPVPKELLDFSADKGRIRLSRFWKPLGGEEGWDLCPERTKFFSEHISTGTFVPAPELTGSELSIRLPDLIINANAKIDEHAVPMFRQVAKAHGVIVTPF
jgi:hypothetical protein